MQDDIINLLITIETEISWILANTITSESRQRRYKINNTTPNIFHKKLATEAQVMQDIIGVSLSTQHMLGQIVRRQKNIWKLLKYESYETICDRIGIHYRVHADGKDSPFVPTDKNHNTIIQIGSWNGWESSRQQPKFLEFVTLLCHIETPDGGHIDTRDIMVDLQSDTPVDIIRILPYMVVRIPRLSRTIIIDEQIGEATFILQGIIDLDIIRETDKKWLEVYHGAKRVIYDESWWENIIHYLTNNWDIVDPDTPIENIPTPRTNMDKTSLFTDKEIILKDLTEFARIWGVALTKLSTSTPTKNTNITLSNGIKINWGTYLNHASKVLLGTKQNSKIQPHRNAEALDILFKKINLIRYDKEIILRQYFSIQNKENILTDLNQFAQEHWINFLELTAGTQKNKNKIILSNGIEMSWRTYLDNASKYLLGTSQSDKNNPHQKSEALELLFKLNEIYRVNKLYFENTQNIIYDLMEFVRVGGTTLEMLSTKKPKEDTIIILTNWITINWRTYLERASNSILETQHNNKENWPKKSQALNKLCKLAGIERITKNKNK